MGVLTQPPTLPLLLACNLDEDAVSVRGRGRPQCGCAFACMPHLLGLERLQGCPCSITQSSRAAAYGGTTQRPVDRLPKRSLSNEGSICRGPTYPLVVEKREPPLPRSH